MSRHQWAIEHIELARRYTQVTQDTIDEKDWYTIPPGCVTNVIWQVGHLAIAQYRLALQRVRGERPEDADLIDPQFLPMYAKSSVPSADPAQNLPLEVVRETFAAVHRKVLEESTSWTAAELDVESLPAHPFFQTKLQALEWCSLHEMTHAGQIGLIRRMFGESPRW